MTSTTFIILSMWIFSTCIKTVQNYCELRRKSTETREMIGYHTPGTVLYKVYIIFRAPDADTLDLVQSDFLSSVIIAKNNDPGAPDVAGPGAGAGPCGPTMALRPYYGRERNVHKIAITYQKYAIISRHMDYMQFCIFMCRNIQKKMQKYVSNT